MNVTMICFSQSGNTRRVAVAMAEAFREAGHVVRIVPLKSATPQDATTGDLLGVGTPCFSSQAPTPVKAFLRTLPRWRNSKRLSLRLRVERLAECCTILAACCEAKGHMCWAAF